MRTSLTLETTWRSALRAVCLALVLLGFLPSLRAQQFGLFSYRILGNAIEITGYPRDAVGPVEIPAVIAGLPVTSIDVWAFLGCTGLTSVTIPSSFTNIGTYEWSDPADGSVIAFGAFSGCTGLTNVTLEQGLTMIGASMFSGCIGLTSITIPSSVTNIGGGAFSGCTGLGSFVVEPGNTVYSSLQGVLFNAAQTAVVSFPLGKAGHYGIPEGVTSIGAGAFNYCTGLTSVTIPEGVSLIGDHAFDSCTGLTSVTIPSSVTSIAGGAFAGCTGLTSVTIPEGVTSISAGTFYYCTALTSVTIPSSVTSIGEDAFSYCTGLTSVTIPSSVTSIAGGAFIRCTGLTHVSIPSSVTSLGSLRPPGGWGWRLDRPFEPPAPEPVGAFAECTGLTSIRLSTNLTSIAEKTFAGCTGLTSITIPSSVTSIDEYAFSQCTGLTSVSFSEGLITIEGYAFSGCTGLTSVTIPSSVTLIGPFYFGPARIFTMAFPGCTALTRAVFLGNAPGIASSSFIGAAPGFTIYHLSSREGFTSPTWNGYPATMIDEAAYPAAAWLLTHGLWYDSDLRQDPDADGVNLLTAYALNLDPRLNLRGRLPAPVLGADTLSLNFHASTPGITYRVETSTNLTHWTTTGVTQPAPGTDGRSTASVLRDAPHRFLRLLVQED